MTIIFVGFGIFSFVWSVAMKLDYNYLQLPRGLAGNMPAAWRETGLGNKATTAGSKGRASSGTVK